MKNSNSACRVVTIITIFAAMFFTGTQVSLAKTIITPVFGVLLLKDEITSVYPDNGPLAGGNVVVLTGKDISNGLAGDIVSVTLKGVPVSQIISFDKDHVYVESGSAGSAGYGNAEVYSVSKGLSRKSAAYTYNPQGVINDWAIVGNTVLLSGSNFGNGKNIYRVSLIGVNANILVQSSDAVYVQVGPGTSGTGAVEIYSASHGLTTASGFVYPAPTASAVSAAPAGEVAVCEDLVPFTVTPGSSNLDGDELVLISGKGFRTAVQGVTFNGMEAEILAQTGDAIVARTGSSEHASVGDVVIQTSNCGKMVLEDGFTYR